MKLRNFTPHAFAFYALAACVFDQKSRKHILQAEEGGGYPFPFLTVAPEPTPLRAITAEQAVGEFSFVGQGSVPDVEIAITSCDPLPELADDEIAIVSMIYMASAKAQGWDTSKLRTTLPCYLAADALPFGVVKLVR